MPPVEDPRRMHRPPGFRAWLQVVRCYQLGTRRMAERLAPLDLTTAQLDVLANLLAGPEEGLTQDQLGQRLLVTKGNVSGLLDRLGQRGLIERRPHPESRRTNLVLLTEEGKAISAQAVALQSRFVEELMGQLSDEQVAQFGAVLERVEEQLRELGEPRNITLPGGSSESIPKRA